MDEEQPPPRCPHVPSTMAADAVTHVHGAYVRLAAHVKRAEALVHEARANSREIKNILEQQQLLTRQANDTAGKLRSELGQVKVRSAAARPLCRPSRCSRRRLGSAAVGLRRRPSLLRAPPPLAQPLIDRAGFADNERTRVRTPRRVDCPCPIPPLLDLAPLPRRRRTSRRWCSRVAARRHVDEPARLQAEQHAKVQAQRLSTLWPSTPFVEKSSSCASAAAAAAAAAAAVGAPFSPATALVPVEGAAPPPAPAEAATATGGAAGALVPFTRAEPDAGGADADAATEESVASAGLYKRLTQAAAASGAAAVAALQAAAAASGRCTTEATPPRARAGRSPSPPRKRRKLSRS